MRRRLTVICIWITLLLLTSATFVLAEAPQQESAATTTSNLNLRSGPGTHWRLLGTVPAGTPVRLDGRDSRGEWVRGLPAGSSLGWMSVSFLDIAPERVVALPIIAPDAPSQLVAGAAPPPAAAPAAAPEGPGIAASATANINVRSGPGTNFDRVSRLNFQTQVRVDGRSAAGDWVRAALPDGSVGWVSAAYLTLTAQQVAGLPVVEGGAVAAPAAGPAPDAAPVASTSAVRGFNLGGHVSGFGTNAISAMQRAGMTWVKKQVRWHGDAHASVKGLVDDAHAKGFRILLGIVGLPGAVNEPGYFERYASFVAGAAAVGADAIEIWNEQNIDREWAAGSIDPGRYTQLLRLSYNAIKAANPNTLVISGAPAPTGFFGGCSGGGCDDNIYLARMASAGAANYMDCIGIHYNEGIVPPSQRSGDPRGSSGHYTRYFWGMVDTYSNAFGGARPLCFTELGYLTPEGYGPLPGHFAWAQNVTVAQQARWLADAVSLSRNSGKVRLLIIWNVDFTYYGSDPMAGYAMIRPDGSCLACDALAGR